ncbi:MAG: TlpA family protein disulfide reductase [Angustibacter sp.]
MATDALLGVVLVVTLLNLLLLLGVVRRLKEHEGRLASMPDETSPAPIVPPGGSIAPFTAQSVTGVPVDDGSMADALVGFFSPGCGSCRERLPGFQLAAADHRGLVLAVVVEDGGDTTALVDGLGEAATIVLEPSGGPVAEAFAVRGFPAFALVGNDRTIQASGFELPLRTA